MKVLFINTVYGKGSTGRIIKDLGETLTNNGHEFCVAFGRGEDTVGVNSYRIGAKKDYTLHALFSRVTDRAGFYSASATKELVKFIKEFNPDIIHLHNLHGYYVNVKILFEYLKNEFKGKVIWTLHDCWAFTGHCTHFTYAKCDKWQSLCGNCSEKCRYPKSMLLDNSKKNFLEKKELFSDVSDLTVVTVSDWLKEETKKSFLGQYPVKRIYNGIDLEKFSPCESKVREKYNCENKKLVLCVSDGWDERKGFSKLIETAKISPEDWKYIVVGLDKAQIPQLPSNVVGLERTWNQQELIALYSAADVFFNPSVEETFGLVTAEAMACGTPVVVLNSTSSPELIKREKSGVIASAKSSSEDLFKAIKEAMPLKYNGGKEDARENALEFSVKKHNDEYMKLYTENEVIK